MSKEEEVDFASLMEADGDVTKLRREASARDVRVNDAANGIQLDQSKSVQREAALGKSTEQLTLESLPPETYQANDVMGFKQPGVQEGVYKKLRTGRYEIEAKLDLHGLTVKESLPRPATSARTAFADHSKELCITKKMP